ncbi:MAG: MFS transporter [Propionibacteriaceae bacterium]|nr:MFS transporter [Propionibacteriaceae bacterium]
MDATSARPSPMAWVVWGVGLAAYISAVMQRTSLGVVGTQAAEHFDTSVGLVSTFVVVQIATYALMQIPAGVLLDRFGSRNLLVTGSLVMMLGQIAVAMTDDFGVAIVGRIVLGAGDAFIFTGILRLLPFWFKPSRVPILSQLTGMLGQLGQVAAVGILLPMMQWWGWRPTFLSAAGVCLVMAICCLLAVRDVPPGVDRVRSTGSPAEIPGQVAQVLRHPAAQLGFWIHLTSGFPINTFTLMWGIPYLIIGEGRSAAEAGVLFSLTAIFGALIGPLVGWLTSRHPLRRSSLALSVIFANMISWATVLLWPGQAPLWLLVFLMIAIAAGGPATGIGFDYARTQLPANRLGAGNGMIITGSFAGGTIMILAIGLFLDAVSDGLPYTAGQLGWAMALQFPLFAVGLVGVFVSRRRLRNYMVSEGVVVPTWRQVAQRYRR